MNVANFTQLALDGLTSTCVEWSLLPLLCRLNAVKPDPKAEAGRRADASREPVTCGGELSGAACAEPARPRQSVVVAAVTAIALNFMVVLPARGPTQPGPLALTARRDDHSAGRTRGT